MRTTLRDALRHWRTTPGITTAVMASMTLGIGAAIGIFSLLNALYLKPLPVRDSGRLVTLRDDRSPTLLNLRVSYPMMTALQRDPGSLAAVAAYAAQPINVAGRGVPVRHARGLFVTGSFFDVAGTGVQLGRALTPADDDWRAPSAVAVISDAYWRSAFGADAAVIGRVLDLGRRQFTVVGVAEPRFAGLELGRHFDIAVPAGSYGLLYDSPLLRTPQGFWLTAIARLRPGQSIAEAEGTLRSTQLRVIREAELPGAVADAVQRSTWRLVTTEATAGSVRATYQRPLLVLFGLVGIVLSLSCLNVAYLLLARVIARRAELSVRMSLGASRVQLIGQLAAELAVVISAGTAAGLVMGVIASRGVMWMLSTSRTTLYLDLSMDWRVAAFAAATGTVTALAAGLVPAWRMMRTDPIESLKARSTGIVQGAGRHGLAHVLMAGQVALTFLLVLGGALFAQTLLNLKSENLGFDADRVQLVGVLGSPQTPVAVSSAAPGIQEALRGLPGVTDVAFSLAAPFGTTLFVNYVSVTGPQHRKAWPEEHHTFENVVSANYFETMGMALVGGRRFADSGGAGEVIVNQAFAGKFFGGQSPIGRTIWYGLDQTPRTIVGMVNDTRQRSLRDEPAPVVYSLPAPGATPNAFVRFIVRDGGQSPSPAALAASVERLVPGAAVEVRPLSIEIADTVATERTLTTVAVFFGVFGVLLAGTGVYGMLSREIQARAREIALRVALGARPTAVQRLVGGRLVLAGSSGLVLGTLAALALERAVQAVFYEVRAADIRQLTAAGMVLVLVAVAGTLLPIRRATRLDPMSVLRAE